MAPVDSKKGTPHLFSTLVALTLAAAMLFAGELVALHVEQTTVSSTAPELFPLKNQGLVFQRAALRAPNVLPLYGTSELIIPSVEDKANVFFRGAPTGFQISPVGGGGANLLVMLQKIGALGSDLCGKKLVISLSPGWFLKVKSGWKGYEGNFSPMAASKMIFGTGLNFDLKRDIALRMLESPSTLEGRPLLSFALRRLASGSWLDRLIFWALWPVGKLQTALMTLQDHLAALNYIRDQIKPATPSHPEVLDWSKLIAKVSEPNPVGSRDIKEPPGFDDELVVPGSHDVTFRHDLNASPGWKNLELLLRVLARVHARPLILSMPIGGNFYDREGVSRSAREDYYAKLRALVQRYRFPLVEFKGHDEDPAFLIRHESHLTAKGWMYYNRALDDFFHGRSPRS
jgi:D-alanine transfer protein